MQIWVPIIPNRNAQKGILTQKARIGQPRQPTLQDGRQWPNKFRKCLQRRMATAQICTLFQLLDQKSVGSSKKQRTMSKEEAPADQKPSSWPTTVAERPTAANERNISSAIRMTEILVKVSSRKWERILTTRGRIVRAFSSGPISVDPQHDAAPVVGSSTCL